MGTAASKGVALRQVDRLVRTEEGEALIPQRGFELGRGARAAVLLEEGQLVLTKGLVEGFDEQRNLGDSLTTEVYDALGGRSLGVVRRNDVRRLKFNPAAVALRMAGGLVLRAD